MTTTTDLNTTAGVAAWVKQLPIEGLKAVAASRDLRQAAMINAAQGELILRGESI